MIHLEKTMRDDFAAACENLDTSASREVRGFIKIFLVRYDNGEFDLD